ncbi:MAG: hypothetical protein OSA89_17915 [Mariniblastus sp.]|nr:hypothetical protein [Mariniblastus sp.]
MRVCSVCHGPLTTELAKCEKCGHVNIDNDGSKGSEHQEPPVIDSRSLKFRFSIRVLLLATAVIAIGIVAYQVWDQFTAEYHLEGTIFFAVDDFNNNVNGAEDYVNWPVRFDLELDPTANIRIAGIPVKNDESIFFEIGTRWKFGPSGPMSYAGATYHTTANGFNRSEKIRDLETLLKNTSKRKINSDLNFHKILIEENQGRERKLVKEILLDKGS